jgi:hypothetical protein
VAVLAIDGFDDCALLRQPRGAPQMRKPGRPMSRRSPLIITASFLAATLSLALPTLDIELANAQETVPAEHNRPTRSPSR